MRTALENICTWLTELSRRRIPFNPLALTLIIAVSCGTPEGAPPPIYEVVNRPQPVGGFIDINVMHRNKDVMACTVFVDGAYKTEVCSFVDGRCSVRLPNANAGRITISVQCNSPDVLASWEYGVCNKSNSDGNRICTIDAAAEGVYSTGFTSCNAKGNHGMCEGRNFSTDGSMVVVSVPKQIEFVGDAVPRGDTWIASSGYGTSITRVIDGRTRKEYGLPTKSAGEEIRINAGIAQSDTGHKVYFVGERKYPGVTIRGRWYLVAYDPATDQIEEMEIPAIPTDNILDTSFNPDTRLTFPPLGIGTIAVSRDGESIVLGVPLAALAGGNQIVYLYKQGTGYVRGDVRGLPTCSITPGDFTRADYCPLAESLDGFVDSSGGFQAGVFQDGKVLLGRKNGSSLDFTTLMTIPKATSLCEPLEYGQAAIVKVIGSRVAHPGNRVRLACSLGRRPSTPGTGAKSTIWVQYPDAPRKTMTMPGFISGAVSSSTHNTLVVLMDGDTGKNTGIYLLPWEEDPAKLATTDWIEVGRDKNAFFDRGTPPAISAAGVTSATPSDQFDTLIYCPVSSKDSCLQAQIPPKY